MINHAITVKQEFYDMNAAITEAAHEAKNEYWNINKTKAYSFSLEHKRSVCEFTRESDYMSRCWIHTFEVKEIT